VTKVARNCTARQPQRACDAPGRPLNRHERRRLARHLDELGARNRSGWDDMRSAFKPGRKLFTVEVFSAAQAILDPRIGPGALAALTAAYAAARGIKGGPGCECGLCCAGWTLERVPVGAFLMRVIDPAQAVFGMICPDCYEAPDLKARVVAMLRRDFADDAAEVPAHAFAPGGRA
jgi:hypothetical protein